jgi:ABC-type antimicrobial peptide transport system permease subunit
MSLNVANRRNEFGIRLALGAQSANVLRMILGQGLRLAIAGVVVGLLGAFALTRLLKGLLFGISASDPLSFGAIALLLIAVALLACWIPARRATKVDPLEALRSE